ncbi:MAG: hypothetical protein ABMA15_26060 [Vicinamibacterales bacterium]
MPLPVKDSVEFAQLIDGLSSDVVYARTHLTLLRDLWVAEEQYSREFLQSQTFWSLTRLAHGEAGTLKLARAYDSHQHSLSLGTWLETIRDNLHLFSVEHFRERLKDNPFVESLAESPRTPDAGVLRSDLASVSRSEPTVSKLLLVRDNLIAHRSGKLVLQGRNPFGVSGLSWDDLELLANRALVILNRYSSLFAASTFSAKPVGNDDFVALLALAKRGIDALDAEHQAELGRLGGAS